MKKLLSCSLFVLGSLTAAQAQKGSVLLYGNLDIALQHTAADTVKQNGLINLGIGYQFNDNFTVGLAGGYGINTSKGPGTDKRFTEPTWNAGVFLRYAKTVSPLFSLYAQFDAGYTFRNQKFDNKPLNPAAEGAFRYTGFYGRLTPVVSMSVGKCFALDFSIGGISYQTQTQDVSGAKTASAFNLNFGKQLSIGITKNFGGQQQHGKKMSSEKEDDEDNDAYEDAHRKKEKRSRGDDL
jgi:hypothetical protein